MTTITGTAGNDIIAGLNGSDVIDGCAGIDWVSYATESGSYNPHYGVNERTGVNVDLTAGTSSIRWVSGHFQWDTVDTLINIENVTGTLYADTISGNVIDNVLEGLDGNDTLIGQGGNDTLLGGSGNDALHGDQGPNDTLISSGSDRIWAGSGDDSVFGGASNDRIYGDAGNDTLNGDDGDDLVFGGAGNDAVNGGDGKDDLYGNAGADKISGGNGRDFLVGGAGKDVLTGGADGDFFAFNSVAEMGKTAATRDVITDFQKGSDLIDLRDIDACAIHTGNQAFTFLGQSGFSGCGGELHFTLIDAAGSANDRTIVAGDVNGDKVADFEIELVGLKTLTAADFLL